MNLEDIFTEAINKEASDVHLMSGLKPQLRIQRELVVLEEFPIIDENDILEYYDYIICGNLEKDELYKKYKILNLSINYQGVRFRVNISMSDGKPIFTLRLINNDLPKFEDLGVPEVVRKVTMQSQGIILVTGKINSGKSTTLNVLIDEINTKYRRKIITLESPVEYRHTSKESIIIQKEVGVGGDILTYSDGVKNTLREDPDIIIIGEIKDKDTMDAAIEMAEAGHLVIGTLHTKSCAETMDRIINFYEIKEQMTIKFLLSTLLKLVVTQRLIKGKDKLVLIPEVMVVNNIVSGYIRKDKFSVSEIEDAIQSSIDIGSISLINSLAMLFVKGVITLEQAKAQLEEKNYDALNRTIMQLKVRR